MSGKRRGKVLVRSSAMSYLEHCKTPGQRYVNRNKGSPMPSFGKRQPKGICFPVTPQPMNVGRSKGTTAENLAVEGTLEDTGSWREQKKEAAAATLEEQQCHLKEQQCHLGNEHCQCWGWEGQSSRVYPLKTNWTDKTCNFPSAPHLRIQMELLGEDYAAAEIKQSALAAVL